jgi:hypothetical protein
MVLQVLSDSGKVVHDRDAVPLQLGARAIAFPRLATLGFWLWFGGLVVAPLNGARRI